ncbi:uncharacterized protein LMH87_008403 [Akanthomyces muscarius]|uniref:Oxidoreductase N-terminal domain-containing protein n=1 Tax=Akanthomyces muscarius TaxID=2231603 RepID=A0A9W8QLL3_AKAMU|nr:uncharacterized protein LMH87_008403 [Akanthomyces muscarius]KAJ4159505.1 hypothetical protein LMH87_008403 [Akanthomyces muscarius]
MSNTSRFVTLHKYVPYRALQPDDLVIEHRPNPSIQAGQVLLQPIAFSVDPVTQNRLTGRPGFLPQIALGAPIDGPAVRRVTDSRHPDHSVGDLVVGLMDWASYSVWHPSDDDFLGLSKIDGRLGKPSHMLGVYGINELTAYFGIIEVGDVQPGEAVLISSAAGPSVR